MDSSLFSKQKKRFNTISDLEVADQLQMSGCLAASRHCQPSAADEEWQSPKRPSSTVAAQQFLNVTEVGIYLFWDI